MLEDFDLSIQRRTEGVILSLQSGENTAEVHLDDASAKIFAWNAIRAAIGLQPHDLEGDVTLLPPAVHGRPAAIAWGAFGDGDLTLNVFLGGLRPLGLVMTDEQAREVLTGLEQCLRVPRDLRITKSAQ